MTAADRIQKYIDDAGGSVLIAIRHEHENGDLSPDTYEDAVCPAIVAARDKIAFCAAGEHSVGHVLDVIDARPDEEIGESLIVDAGSGPARYSIRLSWLWDESQWEIVAAEERIRSLEDWRSSLREVIDAEVSSE